VTRHATHCRRVTYRSALTPQKALSIALSLDKLRRKISRAEERDRLHDSSSVSAAVALHSARTQWSTRRNLRMSEELVARHEPVASSNRW
jgi:hypothetical protein